MDAYNLTQASEWTEMRVALQNELTTIKKAVNDLQSRLASPMMEGMAHRVEFKVPKIRQKMGSMSVGHSFFSPRFSAAGINEMQLEFFPLGRKPDTDSTESSTCSLFLWCPIGVKIKYQLFVGNTIRQPEVDEFTSSMGHGHSNFCKLGPEIMDDCDGDYVTIGLQVVEAQFTTTRKCEETDNGGQAEGELKLITKSIQQMCREESAFHRNQFVKDIVWEVTDISKVGQNKFTFCNF